MTPRTGYIGALVALAVVLAALSLARWGAATAEQTTAVQQAPFTIAMPGIVREGGSSIEEPEEPPKVEERIIGHSVEGRPIEAFSIGDGPRVIVLVGGIHAGPEEESVHVVEALLAHYAADDIVLAPDLTLVLVPKANPDGYAAATRLNARQVDLNRNWLTEDWQPVAYAGEQVVSGGTAPLSEPETRALYDFLLPLDPLFVLSYHGYGSLIEDNGVVANGFELAFALTAAYAEAADYEHIREWPYYEITGQFIDAMEEAGVAAADVELEFGDPAPVERNLRGVEAVIREALEMDMSTLAVRTRISREP